MIAPTKKQYSHVEKWSTIGVFPKILSYVKGSILDSDLPKSVILVDIVSKKEFEAILTEIVPFSFQIPTIFLKLCDKTEEQIKVDFPNEKLTDLAFYFYEFKK